MTEVSVSREGVEDDEPPSSPWLTSVIEKTLSTADFKDSCEISVLLTNDQKIRELNAQYRNIDEATDVLSFCFEEDETVRLPPDTPRILGDVVLSMPRLKEQAHDNRGTLPKECAWALSHGVLHLLGYDHQSDDEEQAMRALEDKVLEELGEGFFRW